MCTLIPANADASGGFSIEHCPSCDLCCDKVHDLMNLHRAVQRWDSGHLLLHPSINSTMNSISSIFFIVNVIYALHGLIFAESSF